MIDRQLAHLDKLDGVARPLGSRHGQRLWRLKNARFNERINAGSVDRLGGGRLISSLEDIERFMAMHMDPTLCRDRLDALIQVGLLEDDVRPGQCRHRARGRSRLQKSAISFTAIRSSRKRGGSTPRPPSSNCARSSLPAAASSDRRLPAFGSGTRARRR